MKRLTLLAITLLAATAAAGGCSSPSGHKTTDVDFAQGMVLQDRQAIALADLALQQAAAPQVKELATRVKATREPEIVDMSGWLKTWGEKIPADATDVAAVTNRQPGGIALLTADDLKQLSTVSGRGFDQNFLGRLINNDQGSVELAQKELDNGRYGPAKTLAASIKKDRRSDSDDQLKLLKTVI